MPAVVSDEEWIATTFSKVPVGGRFRYNCCTWNKIDNHWGNNPGRGIGSVFAPDERVQLIKKKEK